jgi:hypothetical protein
MIQEIVLLKPNIFFFYIIKKLSNISDKHIIINIFNINEIDSILA